MKDQIYDNENDDSRSKARPVCVPLAFGGVTQERNKAVTDAAEKTI